MLEGVRASSLTHSLENRGQNLLFVNSLFLFYGVFLFSCVLWEYAAKVVLEKTDGSCFLRSFNKAMNPKKPWFTVN